MNAPCELKTVSHSRWYAFLRFCESLWYMPYWLCHGRSLRGCWWSAQEIYRCAKGPVYTMEVMRWLGQDSDHACRYYTGQMDISEVPPELRA